jgi:hypothetical protein
VGYSFSAADVEFLASAAGEEAVAAAALLPLSAGSMVADVDAVRASCPQHFAAVIETARLRRKAIGKLGERASGWLLTDDALQQATAPGVAARRARRIGARPVHDLTCSIGAELAELVRVSPLVLGSDIDGTRLRMAARNVPAARIARADALAPCSRNAVLLADPGRRAGGRRTFDPASLQPPLPELLAAGAGRDLVVKCAPGLDFAALEWDGEVEITSLDGGVREACLWSAGLAEPGVTRRASVLRSAATDSSNAPEAAVVKEITDAEPDDIAEAPREWIVEEITDAEPDDIAEAPPGEWIVDPDGAIVRAGLVRQYAARHGLWQLDPRIAYLTGNEIPTGTRGFRILEQLKVSEKALRQELHRLDAGSLEILVRGLDVDPDALRKRLKLRGSQPFALVLTRIGRNGVAFLCEQAVTA